MNAGETPEVPGIKAERDAQVAFEIQSSSGPIMEPVSRPDTKASGCESAVLYFNRGTSCYIRLLVSIFSLRKHYSGPIFLMQEGRLDEGIYALLCRLSVTVRTIPMSVEPILVRRASLWRFMEPRHVLVLDSDTIVRGPVDEFFDWIRNYGFVASWFSGWVTHGRTMRSRIEEWRRVVPELISPALDYGPAINGGVQGWSKGASILPAYEELTRRGSFAGCNRIVLDEIALQLLLPRHTHYLAHHAWNTSGSFGDVNEARIVHYHGRKHCRADNPRCELWKEHYFELRTSFRDQVQTLSSAWGDKRLWAFLSEVNRRRGDITVVTAVDPAYARRLQRNIKAWMQLPGLREQRFVVFVNGFRRPSDRHFLDYPNVRVIRWDYPFADSTRREYMLAAFVLGVAKHIKTPYWMKLDADCVPRRRWWEWPDYAGCSIVSHRWTFTRMKGDPGAQRHWFNRLDDVFAPQNPYFRQTFTPDSGRISHRRGNGNGLPLRFNSFCHIERTAFTCRIAEVLRTRCGGRMAIPSHDTTSWYCAQIWQEEVKLVNMRHWFKN